MPVSISQIRHVLRNIFTILLLTMSFSFLLSCARHTEMNIPALKASNDGVYYPGKFIWFELITHDLEKVSEFYSDMFGWDVKPHSPDSQYYSIENAGRKIGGLIAVSDGSMGSRWISTLSVNDVDETASRVRQLGGSVLYPPTDLKNRGRFAQIGDSQGADLIVLKSLYGDPRISDPEPGDIVWVELFTQSKNESAEFYDGLVAYKIVPSKESGEHYYFAVENKIRAGLTHIEWDDVRSNWLPFIGVSNLRAAVLKAIDNGATLLAHTDTAAIILDPGGAAVGLQLLPSGGAL